MATKATDLRAHLNLRTPDALHLAAAIVGIVGGCDVFLTNDRALERCTDIRVTTLAPAP